MRILISELKSPMLKYSTTLIFLKISQLIWIVLQSTFFKLVPDMDIYLYKNSKIQFLCEKKSFLGVFYKFFMNFFESKSEVTPIAANYRKFPYEWLILSTKMIQKC